MTAEESIIAEAPVLAQLSAERACLEAERSDLDKRIAEKDREIAASIERIRTAVSRSDSDEGSQPPPSKPVDASALLVPKGQSYTRSALRNRIIHFVEKRTLEGSTTTTDEIASAVGMADDMSKLFWVLSYLKRDGYLERLRKGVWKFSTNKLREMGEEEKRAVRESADIGF